jgi:hypothetical protein
MTLPKYQYDPDFDVNTIERKVNFDDKSLIGPHEGRAIKLIEMGKKGVFITRKNLSEYKEAQKYVATQELIEIDAYNPKGSIFYRPGLENDAKQVKLFQEKIATAPEGKRDLALSIEDHRKMGEILGYPKKAIDEFCKKEQLRRIQLVREIHHITPPNTTPENDTQVGFWSKLKKAFK